MRLRCSCTHPSPPLGTDLVPGEGCKERQEALCHQLFPLHLAVEVLGFVSAAEEKEVPCRSRAPGLCWEHLVLGTAGATWLIAPACRATSHVGMKSSDLWQPQALVC